MRDIEIFDLLEKVLLILFVIIHRVKIEDGIVGLDVFSAGLGQLFDAQNGLGDCSYGGVFDVTWFDADHGFIVIVLGLYRHGSYKLLINLNINFLFTY